MVAQYTIKIADSEFKSIWEKRIHIKDQVLSDMTLPLCTTIEISKRSDLEKAKLCELDIVCIRPESDSVDGITEICTRVLDSDHQSVTLVVTATLQSPTSSIPAYEKESEPEEINIETFKELMAVFNNNEHNPFLVERKLKLNRSTIYKYLNHDGTPTAQGQQLLNAAF